MKHYTDDKEAIELLRKMGWTTSEIERLREVRRNYIDQGRRKAESTHHRSGFVHWLLSVLQEGGGPSAPW